MWSSEMVNSSLSDAKKRNVRVMNKREEKTKKNITDAR